MTEILYHPEVFMPEWFTKPTERVTLKYSHHAREQCRVEKYRRIPEFDTLPLSQFDVVEIGAKNNELTKVVLRGRLDKIHDAVFVLIPGDDYYFVKTVWVNLHSDKHTTLNRGRYATE